MEEFEIFAEEEERPEASKKTGLLASRVHVARGSRDDTQGFKFSSEEFELGEELPNASFFVRPLTGNDDFSRLMEKASRRYPSLLEDWETQQAVFPVIYATSLLVGFEGVFLAGEAGSHVSSIEAEVYAFEKFAAGRQKVKAKPKKEKQVISFDLLEDGSIAPSLKNRKALLLAFPSIARKVSEIAADKGNFEGLVDAEEVAGN